ncbi:hypothetical protein ACFSTE_09230 [Aquimarina hainanensis]|uniref:Carboxypeptidase regulatory-like domain-containing protein n=2 Tax=Aquimarina hainanensis TaxID=1578017 RepID=A0ABW5N7K6_9FLAO
MVIKKKWILATLGVVVLGMILYFAIFFISRTDIKNVHVEGYVFDQTTEKPLSNVKVIINNNRYEDDAGNANYDEYLGNDRIELNTNANGFYSTEINKSAYLWIDFSKESYQSKTEDGQYASKNMKFKTYLKKDKD